MTPQEKAKDMLEVYVRIIDPTGRKDYPKKSTTRLAKQCALIAADEVIASEKFLLNWFDFTREMKAEPNFWNQVKEEIQKL